MIANWAKAYIGIPFVSLGRTKEGCDCYGLLRLIQKEVFGIEMPPLTNDYQDACNVKQTKGIFEKCLPVLAQREAAPIAGCAVVLVYRGWASHLGTYIGSDCMITTEYKPGASFVQRLSFLDTRSKIEGFYYVKNNG